MEAMFTVDGRRLKEEYHEVKYLTALWRNGTNSPCNL